MRQAAQGLTQPPGQEQDGGPPAGPHPPAKTDDPGPARATKDREPHARLQSPTNQSIKLCYNEARKGPSPPNVNSGTPSIVPPLYATEFFQSANHL